MKELTKTEKGIAISIIIGIWILFGVGLVLSNINKEIVVSCSIVKEIEEQTKEGLVQLTTQAESKTLRDVNTICPKGVIPDTITLRNNYDLVSKSKWEDRTPILNAIGERTTLANYCYMGVRSWQEPDYLYCENTLYDGDEGRYLITVTLDTDRDYNKDKDLIEYEIVDVGCLRRG